MDAKTIGRKVRELRSKMGLTTVTLAKRLRLSQAQVSRLENGLQGFRSGTLVRFAKVLGVDPVYFFVQDADAPSGKVARELKARGLAQTPGLRKAMANAAFLRFAERCAKAFREDKLNLEKMQQLIRTHF